MTYATHTSRRIRRSAVPHAPLDTHSKIRKDLMLGALVGVSMLIITGLYAATFRYQKIFSQSAQLAPRWSALQEGIIERGRPVQTQFENLKSAVVAVVNARKSQDAAAEILKKKLEARGTGQPIPAEAPETPEKH